MGRHADRLEVSVVNQPIDSVCLVVPVLGLHVVTKVEVFGIQLGEGELVAVKTREKLPCSVHVYKVVVKVEVAEHVCSFLLRKVFRAVLLPNLDLKDTKNASRLGFFDLVEDAKDFVAFFNVQPCQFGLCQG